MSATTVTFPPDVTCVPSVQVAFTSSKFRYLRDYNTHNFPLFKREKDRENYTKVVRFPSQHVKSIFCPAQLASFQRKKKSRLNNNNPSNIIAWRSIAVLDFSFVSVFR